MLARLCSHLEAKLCKNLPNLFRLLTEFISLQLLSLGTPSFFWLLTGGNLQVIQHRLPQHCCLSHQANEEKLLVHAVLMYRFFTIVSPPHPGKDHVLSNSNQQMKYFNYICKSYSILALGTYSFCMVQ